MKNRRLAIFLLVIFTISLTFSEKFGTSLKSYGISSNSTNGSNSYLKSINDDFNSDFNSPISSEKLYEKPKFSWKNASVYYLMTDRFYNGDPNNDESYGRKKIDAFGNDVGTFNGGDIKGITIKLKEGYFKKLGINALWISAPYEQIHGFVSGGKNGEFAHYADHGYYPLDYTMMDKNFGTIDEFRQMVDEAHSQGIRIILDVVINHAGYNTIKDMEEFSFGKLNGIDSSWQPKEGENYKSYHEYIDYNDPIAWANWWGKDWIRAGLPGYKAGGKDDLTMNLAGLPDFLTEGKKGVDLAPILKTKWAKEDESFAPWRLKNYKEQREKRNLPPSLYISSWLVEWVREFGIDGFRIDTAKHVDLEVWNKLKIEANEALKTWRHENKGKAGSEFTEDFFMVGEVWGQGPGKTIYHDKGFDALINFAFQGEATDGPAYNLKSMEETFNKYSEIINSDINFMSYISSHDTRLYPRNKLKDGISYLSLLPGAIEVFYGDESKRPYGESLLDISQSTRSKMNWDSLDMELLNHAMKMLSFRNRHIAIGAGENKVLNSSPLIFSRVLGEDKVLIAIGLKEARELDVSHIAREGYLLDYYNNIIYPIIGGKIKLEANNSGIILLELVDNAR